MKVSSLMISVLVLSSTQAWSKSCYEILEDRKMVNMVNQFLHKNPELGTPYSVAVGLGGGAVAVGATKAAYAAGLTGLNGFAAFGLVGAPVFVAAVYSPLIIAEGIKGVANIDENKMQKLIKDASNLVHLGVAPGKSFVKTYAQIAKNRYISNQDLINFSKSILTMNEDGSLCDVKNIKGYKKIASEGGVDRNLQINDQGREIIKELKEEKAKKTKGSKVNKV